MTSMNSAIFYRQLAGLPFQGRTDKYLNSRNRTSLDVSIDDALDGNTVYDVTGVAINEDQRDTINERLSRYAEADDFYKGSHFLNAFEEGERKTVFNFCKVVVDKAVNWHEAKGWNITSIPGNEEIAKYLNYVWAYNNRGVLSLRQAQFGAKGGDSYYYVTARTVDEFGKKLPRKKWTVRIQVLNPSHVTPIWSDTDEGKMKACLIQMPVASTDVRKDVLLTIWITNKRIRTYENTELTDDIENVLGEVPVVHVPNFPLSGSQFGQSDIEDIMPVNVEYNAIAHSIRRILKYHAEPTTIIYGVRASQLEKGANAVWSGLPETAKVENLKLDSDLKASFDYLSQLRTLISELSHTPKIAFDGTDTIPSNISAAALELAFQPLLEKTYQRQKAHRPSIQEVNRLVMRVETEIIGVLDLKELADEPERLEDTCVEYTTPLPRDEAQLLDLNIKKVSAGVISQAELIRVCSDVKNVDRLVLELMADKRAMLMEAYEQQRAVNGERPNTLSAFLGSETLSSDMKRIIEEIAVLEKLGGDETDNLIEKDATVSMQRQLKQAKSMQAIAPKQTAPAKVKVKVTRKVKARA